MKKIIPLGCLFVLAFGTCPACREETAKEIEAGLPSPTRASNPNVKNPAYYYYYHDEKVFLTLNTGYVNVLTGCEHTLSDKEVQNTGCDIVGSRPSGEYVITGLRLPPESENAGYPEVVDRLRQIRHVKKVFPFFNKGENSVIGMSDIFYVELKEAEDIALLYEMRDEHGVEILREVPYTPLWYILSIGNSTFDHTIDAANHFYETHRFKSVDPAFLFDFQHGSVRTDVTE